MESVSVSEFCKMSYAKRYAYSINFIRNKQMLWVLQNKDGRIPLNEGYDGVDEFIIWPNQELAQYNRNGDWANTMAICLSVDLFMSEMSIKIKERGIRILMSPMRNLRGRVLTIDSFIEAIEDNGKI